MRKSYNIPDDVYDRMRVAAACGNPRVPKGALERFVVQAIRRALDSPLPGAGLPRLKLCSHCFAVNQVAANVPKPTIVPRNPYETHPRAFHQPSKPPAGIFSHLITDGALAGLMGDDDPIFSELAGSHGTQGEPVASVALSETASSKVIPGLELAPRLWLASDFEMQHTMADIGMLRDVSVLSAQKEPWHRQMVGYKTSSAPEGPERLVARRGNHMALNLIDVRELGPGGAHYVAADAIEAGLKFIAERLTAGDQVIVHDKKAESMAPALVMLWMWREGLLPRDSPLPAFVQKYANFLPSAGVREYLRKEFALEPAA